MSKLRPDETVPPPVPSLTFQIVKPIITQALLTVSQEYDNNDIADDLSGIERTISVVKWRVNEVLSPNGTSMHKHMQSALVTT